MQTFFNGLESILGKHRAKRPGSAGDGGFFSHWWFTISDLQANLASSALESMVLATGITLLVLLLATRSLTATIIATCAIAGVLCCTMAVLVVLGWEMGIIESMCLAILIGISCDFVVHLAWAYVTAGESVDTTAQLSAEAQVKKTRSETDLKATVTRLRRMLDLSDASLAYDESKTFPHNRTLLATEVAHDILSDPKVLTAERKMALQRTRFARTQFALGTMGISVASAAVTTLVAAVALSKGIIEFFHAFGLFLIFTISFAIVFAIVFFVAGTMMYGPTASSCRRDPPRQAAATQGAAAAAVALRARQTTDI